MKKRIKKFLKKLERKRRNNIASIIIRIETGNLSDLNVKKLQGFDDRYRVRVGRIRIIFEKDGFGFSIKSVSNRDDETYNF